MNRRMLLGCAFTAMLSVFLSEPVKAATGDPVADLNALKAAISATSMTNAQKALLNNVLSSAIARINQGNPAGAITLLNVFKAYVQRYIDSGYIDAVTGQSWKDEADAIIAEI